jgi:flagellar hook-length control protein FliK
MAPSRAAADVSASLSSGITALKDGLANKKADIHSAVIGSATSTAQAVTSERAGAIALPADIPRITSAAEAAAPALQAVVSALAEMSAQARQGGRSAEEGGTASPALGLNTDVGSASFTESLSTAADATPTAADGSAMAGDGVQAEPVAFWVNQKTQNAELTLDRDGQPVEVRVSLTGNEAHVTFRSDQAQTREALDASMLQLRELLQREGLVLAGVTVGSSGSQGEGGQGEQSGRQGARQGRVVATTGDAAEGPARVRTPGQGGTRGVDVFV